MKTQEKSDREKAIEWWNELTFHQKQTSLLAMPLSFHNTLLSDNLLDNEIEQIWRKETQQIKVNNPYLDAEIIMIDKNGNKTSEFPLRSQVDFELLKETFDNLYRDLTNVLIVSDDYIDNFKLFFELLSKSSTFAHKAHKELNKLIK